MNKKILEIVKIVLDKPESGTLFRLSRLFERLAQSEEALKRLLAKGDHDEGPSPEQEF